MKFNNEILDLETKISELKNFSREKKIDLSLEIEKLTKQRDEYLKTAYESLTDWD
ncbi:MAG: acetyl-CoA carboxylase carboxyl transferase subunit alpha, partial [Cetobacterium sp.]